MKEPPIDKVFRAFSDMNRLRIINLLREGEQCVCDIMRVLRMRQSRVSRHLAYLREAGLVHTRKDGLWVHYSLVESNVKFKKHLFACIEACCDDVPVLKNDLKVLDHK